jgi:isochorismate synthase
MESSLFFKEIEHHYDEELPFVCIAQKQNLKAYLQSDNELVELTDFNSSGFVFCPFSMLNKKIIFPENRTEFIESRIETIEVKTNKKSIIESKDEKGLHLKLVSKAIKAIGEGQAQKIVCSRKIKISGRINPIETFKKLAQLYPEAYSYCWYHPKIGLWTGATPERFINLDRNVLKTVALAGTLDALEYLQPKWRPKEQDEQQMVTDFIVSSLEKHSNTIRVQDVESVRAGNLWHLKTNISAEIQPDSLSEIINELHPTSAVCGLPQSATKSFILEHENYNREYYAGFLGELNIKTSINRRKQSLNQEQLAIKSIKTISDLYVNLRCMQVFEDHVEIYVGGGITKDSNPKAEFEETVAKSQTLLNVL